MKSCTLPNAPIVVPAQAGTSCHRRGAQVRSKRQLFATDARFLIAVDKSANRSKSDKWPVEWLPPNQKYHCSYISIFSRAVLIHDFILTDDETGALDKLLRAACDSNP